MSMFFVGIDVSKDYSTAQGLDQDGKKLFYVEFGMNGEGFFRPEVESTKEQVAVTKMGKPVALIQFITDEAFSLKTNTKGKEVKKHRKRTL